MTDKDLRQYRGLIREIDNQERRIDILCSKEVPVVAGKVKSSMRGFPYTEVRIGVQMEDPVIASEIDKLISQKRKRVKECWRQVRMIEAFISAIKDSELRQVFEYRYIDGMKLREIGELMNMDFTGVGRKIKAHLQKFQQNQQNP